MQYFKCKFCIIVQINWFIFRTNIYIIYNMKLQFISNISFIIGIYVIWIRKLRIWDRITNTTTCKWWQKASALQIQIYNAWFILYIYSPQIIFVVLIIHIFKSRNCCKLGVRQINFICHRWMIIYSHICMIKW